MSKIKIGDRVSAEWQDYLRGRLLKIFGVYDGLDEKGLAKIITKGGSCLVVPKSMRKLKPKKEKEFLGFLRVTDTFDKKADVNVCSSLYASEEKAKSTGSSWPIYKIYGERVE